MTETVDTKANRIVVELNGNERNARLTRVIIDLDILSTKENIVVTKFIEIIASKLRKTIISMTMHETKVQ